MEREIIAGLNEEEVKAETRTYSIKAFPKQLDEFERFFSYVQYCGDVGHSAAITLCVDGDGNARLEIKRTDDNKRLVKAEFDENSSDDPSFSID